MKAPVRIRASDPFGKAVYIHRVEDGPFRCTFANGVETNLSRAGVYAGQRRCAIALDLCEDGDQALAILKRMGSRVHSYRLERDTDQQGRPHPLDALSALEEQIRRIQALLPAVAELVDAGAVDLAHAALVAQHGETDTPVPTLYLHLFHGRENPAANLDERGTDGPIIGPLSYVHTTYMCDVKFAASLDVMERFFPDVVADWRAKGITLAQGRDCEWQFDILDDLIHHDGVFYGDWSVFTVAPSDHRAVSVTLLGHQA